MSDPYIAEQPPIDDAELTRYLYEQFQRIQNAFIGNDLSSEYRYRTRFVPSTAMYEDTDAPGVRRILTAGRGVLVHVFDMSAPESLYVNIQMPYDYAQGLTLRPVVYWTMPDTPSASTTIIWGLEHTRANLSGTLSMAVQTRVTATVRAQLEIMHTALPAITATGATILSIGLYRLYRDASADSSNLEAALLGLGLHYEADAHGGVELEVK